ncbi:hypothetical protein D9M70_296030 [compost metagenome]
MSRDRVHYTVTVEFMSGDIRELTIRAASHDSARARASAYQMQDLTCDYAVKRVISSVKV